MDRSENMRRIRSKDMKPELVVRRVTHRLGFRYRLHGSNLPGKPDLVFSKKMKVIFVHGCFWHQHADRNCRITRKPKSNLDYWLPKLERNKTRDAKVKRMLTRLEWNILTIWECDTSDLEQLESTLYKFLS